MKRKSVYRKTKPRAIRKTATKEAPVITQLRTPDHYPLTLYQCKLCNYKWLPRMNKPEQCPNCKRRNWH
jgi:rubrerythrin